MSSRWVPLSVRRGRRDAESFEVLHEGVPSWIRHQVHEWVEQWLSRDSESLALVQTMLQLPDLGWEAGPQLAWQNLQTRMLKDEDLFLDVLDLILRQLVRDEGEVRDLEAWLSLGGSAWTVVCREDECLLERRVDETVSLAANEVIAEAGRAGTHLARAWRNAYGRDPQPTLSYDEAIKAVETAAVPTISPRNDRATLGTLIRDLRADGQNFGVTLSARGGTEDLETVSRMMGLLWKGHPARHGSPDPSRRTQASQAEAEAAVHLAVILVHWFDKGFITRA